MKRRAAIRTLVAGVAGAGTPLAAPAQMRRGREPARVGALMGYAVDDPEGQRRLRAFRDGMASRGWTEGSDWSVQVRWTGGDANEAERLARELIALHPEVIVSSTTPATAALARATHDVPIVFTVVSDPVGSGFVQSLAKPGGNLTGLVNLEAALITKSMELLKQLVPPLARVMVLYNPATAPYAEFYLGPLRSSSGSLGIEATPLTVARDADLEPAIASIARAPASGLVVMTDSFMVNHRKTVIDAAQRHRVPASYFATYWVDDGGLASYGVDVADIFTRAASHVDRILRGAKPGDLPVERPSKFELAINLRTAEALSLHVPETLLVRADKVVS